MNHNETVEFRLGELLADRPAAVSELAIKIRRHISKSAANASEMLYKTYAVSNVFTFSDRLKEAFIHIATYSDHVNLGFNYGAQLPDPDRLLEGTGKAIRHLRIDSLSQLKKPAVVSLIAAAIELGTEMAENSDRTRPQQLIDKSS